MTVRELIKHLRSNFELDEQVAYHIWTAEDVQFRALEMNVVVTSEQADSIVSAIEDNKDCNYGITWDTVQAQIELELAMGEEDDE
jgi:hypothetical protein